ncbi:hypothetical protein HMPREF1869_00343 [Bacteroidales bacterium KA00251]|nr:hypothetical protein HMPREF1869_00343 [Bacteroidales bacterium KA00251]
MRDSTRRRICIARVATVFPGAFPILLNPFFRVFLLVIGA